MTQRFTRRQWLQSAVAGAVVLGFDPRRRSWITEAWADGFDDLPPELAGKLHVDATSKATAADDFGHIVHRQPVAVLRPTTANDVAVMVRYARRHGIRVAMRGQGHANFGQSQVDAGVVIDSSTLATIHAIHSDRAIVDAGVTWATLVSAAAESNATPPVLTDYLDLAVGGTLSVGGIGGGIHLHGAQVDNVLELDVVTGRGDLITCSHCIHPDLFNAVLAGQGQCALVVRATVRLVPLRPRAQVFHLFYDDIATYTNDQTRLVMNGRFDYLEGQVVPHPSGTGWRYLLEAAVYYTPPDAPDPSVLLAGLHDDRPSMQTFTTTYLDWAFRLRPVVEFLKSIGVWNLPHPWYSVFVPASAANDYVGSVMAELTTEDTGQGPVLFYPVRTDLLRRPLFRMPRERIAFAFNILRNAPPDPAVIDAMLRHNRALYDQLVSVGGTRYSIGAIPMRPHDWTRHFQPAWGLLVSAKHRYDPDAILTPGPGIFD